MALFHTVRTNLGADSPPPGESGLREWRVVNNEAQIRRLAPKLVSMAPGEVRCCYEAGPCGFALQRQLESKGELICEVIAPSLVPVKPGDRVKTDRRDARKLAELFRAGMLTTVHPPTPEEEMVRDLCRCREANKDDFKRARHRVGKFLLRNGVIYSHSRNKWTRDHYRWLRRLHFDNPTQQRVFDEYMSAVDYFAEREKGLDQAIETVSESEPYRHAVGWLRCFHGVDTLTAMVVVTEIFDIRRFQTARQLMGYLGLVPSEHSTGDSAQCRWQSARSSQADQAGSLPDFLSFLVFCLFEATQAP